MSRDLTTGVSDALQGPVIRPVVIVHLDIADDPVSAWTGPGLFMPSGATDPVLDGKTFVPVGPMADMSPVQEGQGLSGPLVLSAAGHDLDDALLRQIVRDKRVWRGRRAYVWMGLLDEDQASVISDPFRVKTGYMTEIRVSRDEGVDVTVDRDLGNSRAAPFRWLDHTRYFPEDTASTFMVKLANKPRGLERGDIRDAPVHPGSPEWYGQWGYWHS